MYGLVYFVLLRTENSQKKLSFYRNAIAAQSKAYTMDLNIWHSDISISY